MANGPIRRVASRRWRRAFATAAMAAVGLAGWGAAGLSLDASGQGGPIASAPRTSAVALARLLPASGLVQVGVRPGMRVVELKVKEDDNVSTGDVLAILEGHDAARSQLDLAEARKRRADHERSVRLAAARKAADLSRRRHDEAKKLHDQFGGTLKGKDRYDAEMALYQVEMQAIQTQLDLDLAQGPDTEETDDRIVRTQVDLAASALRETEVRAPGAGRILRIVAEAGEISSGALLVMGDVSSMVAKAEVYQADVPRIKVGDPAEVDILGTRVPGIVARIGSIVGKNQLVNIDPRAPRDLRVVEATIALERAEPASRFVEMEVDAVIRPLGPGAAGSSR